MISFFGLPREIRDIIYVYSVISLSEPAAHERCKQANKHGCPRNSDERTLTVLRMHLPFFAYHTTNCDVPDRWLYSASLVSKQFAAESWPAFFQHSRLYVNNSGYDRRRPPKYAEFIRALGPHARDLRYLTILTYTVWKGDQVTEASTMFQPGSPLHGASFDETLAQNELDSVAPLLHPGTILSLVLDLVGDRGGRLFFHCVVVDDSRSVVARRAGSNDIFSGAKHELHASYGFRVLES